MVGAKTGLARGAYVACPAGLAEIAAATLSVPTAFAAVRIAPGVRAFDTRGAPT